MNIKVFLGGTCNESTWRDEIIPLLEEAGIDYFNPIVEDWTEKCIEVENIEKNERCNIHLYVITKEMKGVYSIAEAVDSAWSIDGNNLLSTIFYVIEDGFDEGEIRSFKATSNLIKEINGRAVGYVGKGNLRKLVDNIKYLKDAFSDL